MITYDKYLLTQLIYARTKLPQKGLLLFRMAWNMLVLFSICFYQIHISKINDRVSITKTLVYTHMKSKDQCSDKLVSQKKFIYFPA